MVSGEAWWVDTFGNVQTNIAPEDLAAIGIAPGEEVTVRIGATVHSIPWVRAYGDVEEGATLLHVDSVGLLTIAVRGDRADEELDLIEGVSVSLSASRSATAG